MFNLVQNENMKIYRRVRTWILIAILVAATVAVSILIASLSPDSGGDWREDVQKEVAALREGLSEGEGMPDTVKTELENLIKLNEHRLEHDIPPTDDTLWGGVLNAADMILLVTIFTVIVAADIVAGEFSAGTIKMLLIRPASRTKILASKYLAVLLFSLALLLILFATAVLTNLALHGASGAGAPHLYIGGDGAVHETNILLHVIKTYGLQCVELVIISTMAFMISSVFRSSAMAISLSMLILFVGQSIALFLVRYDWGKYFLFANTDLTQYLNGRPLAEGMTMGFSIAVLLVYYAVFLLLSWWVFNRRDVAA